MVAPIGPEYTAPIGMPAPDLAIDRAGVEACPAADAAQQFTRLLAKDLRAAVVDEDHMELLRPFSLVGLPRARDNAGVHRQRLGGGAPGKQLRNTERWVERRDHLLNPYECHVNPWHGGQPGRRSPRWCTEPGPRCRQEGNSQSADPQIGVPVLSRACGRARDHGQPCRIFGVLGPRAHERTRERPARRSLWIIGVTMCEEARRRRVG